jgi:hypothetical protein
MHHTHLFLFVETARSTGEVISSICEMPIELNEIVRNFAPRQVYEFRTAMNLLATNGQTFSRVPYEVVLPNYDVH